jgi:hypothetical protein
MANLCHIQQLKFLRSSRQSAWKFCVILTTFGVSWRIFIEVPHWNGADTREQTDKLTDRRTDTTKLTGVFRNYANSPKYVRNADAHENVVIMTMMRKVEIMANKHIVGKICTQVGLNVLPTKKGRKKVIAIITYLLHFYKWPTWRTILFSIHLFQFSTCFEHPRDHHQENQLYQYNIWYVSLCVGDRCIDTIDSPDDEHEVARNM